MSVSTPAQATTANTIPNPQVTYEDYLNIIEIYKTKICDRKDCKYSKQKVSETDPLLQNECIFSHSKADLRRPVFNNGGGKKAKPTLNYSQYFTIEHNKNQISKSNSDKHCLNDYEYLYHPLNYKKDACELFAAGLCTSPFCVYYHTPEEEEFFAGYRKKFDQSVNLLPGIGDFQKCLSRLNVIVKEVPVEEKRTRSITPDKSPKNAPVQPITTNQIKPKGKSNDEFYILDQSVKFIEDHTHEFKFKLHMDSVLKYVCGFLNSKGGSLYFGINNDGVIKGTEIKEPEMTAFKKKLYENLKKFTPPVGEDDVKANFCPVFKQSKEQALNQIDDLYVVEFIVKKPAKSDIYFTNNRECYVKRSASTSQLKIKEIREYVKSIIAKRNNMILDKLESQLLNYEGRKLDDLSPQSLDEIERKLQNSLNVVCSVLESKK